jgi:hypothetical protein
MCRYSCAIRVLGSINQIASILYSLSAAFAASNPIQLQKLIDLGRQEHGHGVRVFRGLARRVFFTALLAIVVWTVCQFHGTAVDITQVLEGFPLSFIDCLQIALAYRISRIYCMLC